MIATTDLAELFACGAADRRRHVGRRRQLGGRRAAARAGPKPSASRCSSMIMARRPGRKGACCAGDDIRDARAVADRLGIAHYVFDHESASAKKWSSASPTNISPAARRSPASAATWGPSSPTCSHGARTGRGLPGDRALCPARRWDGRRELHRAFDPARDQSYFLYATTEAQLDFLRFPLGGLPKPQVRELAEAAGLRVAAKPDSQDICFVPDGDYAKIVRKVRPEGEAPGEIVHAETGEVLGRAQGHHPLHRRPAPRARDRRPAEPLYVIGLDAPSRRVLVGPRACWRCRRPAGRDQPHRPAAGRAADRQGPLAGKPVPVTLEGPWAMARQR
jgi:tRNA-uridine 2-sulfurtransferase